MYVHPIIIISLVKIAHFKFPHFHKQQNSLRAFTSRLLSPGKL